MTLILLSDGERDDEASDTQYHHVTINWGKSAETQSPLQSCCSCNNLFFYAVHSQSRMKRYSSTPTNISIVLYNSHRICYVHTKQSPLSYLVFIYSHNSCEKAILFWWVCTPLCFLSIFKHSHYYVYNLSPQSPYLFYCSSTVTFYDGNSVWVRSIVMIILMLVSIIFWAQVVAYRSREWVLNTNI